MSIPNRFRYEDEPLSLKNLEAGILEATRADALSDYAVLEEHIGEAVLDLNCRLLNAGVGEEVREDVWLTAVVLAMEAALTMRHAILSSLMPVPDVRGPEPECDVPF